MLCMKLRSRQGMCERTRGSRSPRLKSLPGKVRCVAGALTSSPGLGGQGGSGAVTWPERRFPRRYGAEGRGVHTRVGPESLLAAEEPSAAIRNCPGEPGSSLICTISGKPPSGPGRRCRGTIAGGGLGSGRPLHTAPPRPIHRLIVRPLVRHSERVRKPRSPRPGQAWTILPPWPSLCRPSPLPSGSGPSADPRSRLRLAAPPSLPPRKSC
jgi:hypothetical protein